MAQTFDTYTALEKYVQDVCRRTAGLIRDDLTETAGRAVSTFYADYKPHVYKRHYYNFENNSYQKYYANNHGKVYYGGVEITPQNLESLYVDPTYEVSDLFWNGFHGSPIGKNDIPRMSPSPMDILEERQDYIIDNIQSYIDKAQG